MTVLEALNSAEERLRHIPDPRLDAEYLLAHVLGLPRLNLLMEKRRLLSPRETAAYDALVARRAGREPLQYIIGQQPFMGLSFRTDPRALIPRNDTEALCEAALALLSPGMRALDLCTGSGILGIALSKLRPGVQVTASDISADALALARENADALGAPVRFVQGDLFAPVNGETFDLIVSNPPYIPAALRGKLQAEVEREPALALFAGADGLDFYRRIAREAPGHLAPGGWLLLEIGDDQFPAVQALLSPAFDGITLIRDMNGLPRVIRAERKPI
ncbi:MAG: peptide chain release factor N(5)-glutamine methyltransferase [Clostridia bacterium]|nr:peptide chain release factor N(5)-glutamine methyltransferase [Clostridia bacterium]